MKKVINGIFGWFILLSLLTALFSLIVWKYPQDDGYWNQTVKHYRGSSELTSDEIIYLYSKSYISTYKTRPEIKDNGLSGIDYDFYSDESLSYLIPLEYNFWDTPIFYQIYKGLSEIINDNDIFWYGMVVILIIFIVLWRLSKSKSGTPKQYLKKILDGLWWVFHPTLAVKPKVAPTLKYSSNLIDGIKIDPNQNGIFAMRSWKYLSKNGYLHSTGAGNLTWTNRVTLANKIPTDANTNGLYAYRLGLIETRDDYFTNEIIGIVSLQGQYREHADGIIRAECCEILCLIVNKNIKRIAEQLSKTFGIPILLADKPQIAYKQWVLSKEGIACLLHNAEILKDGEINGNEGANNQKGKDTLPETRRCASTRI